MKLSKGKITYPGRKQVFRIKGKSGIFIKDVLGIENEKISGTPLLKKIVSKGKVIYRPQPIERKRKLCQKGLSSFSKRLKEAYPRYKYPVIISPRLKNLRRTLIAQLVKRQ